MSLSPAEGVDHGAEQSGETVTVNLLEELLREKFMEESPAKVVDVNPGSASVEIVTDADAFDVYQEQSSFPGEAGLDVAATGAT